MIRFEVRDLAPGVRLHVSSDPRWKTTVIAARIAAPLAEDPTRTALVPRVLARGTERSPSATAISRRLEALYDAELEVDVLRLGDAQVLEARVDVPSGAFVRAPRDPLDDAIEFLGELLYRPALDGDRRLREDVVRGESENLRREIEGLRDDRADYAIERTARLLGRGEPSERYELGSTADLPGIGAADLTARWSALVLAYPLDVLAVGAIEADRIEAAVRRAFPLERRAAAPVAIPLPRHAPREGAPVRGLERAAVQQAHLCLGYRTGIAYLSTLYPGLVLLNAVLGADAHSRLFLDIREDGGLAYEAGTILDRMKGTITAHCGVDPSNLARVEDLVSEEVAVLADELVEEDELEESRRFSLERLAELEDEPALRIGFSYGRALAGRLEVTYEDLARRLREVTPEAVREAARALRLDAVFVLTGDEPSP